VPLIFWNYRIIVVQFFYIRIKHIIGAIRNFSLVFMKAILKKVIPESVVEKIRNYYYRRRLNRARKAFLSAEFSPSFLEYDDLAKLHDQYHFDTYVSYEADALLGRGIQRVDELKEIFTHEWSNIRSAVEIGCGDGMVCSVMMENGISATAIDFSDELFDERAKKKGVKFIVSEAEKLPLEDACCDMVFSYNSFEHIMDPRKAFHECLRILRPGGLLYLTFNPIYFSAMGFHSYKSTQVPYLQVLFTEKDIKKFVADRNLADVTFSFTALNKWSVGEFRALWKENEKSFTQLHYRELPNYMGLDLIRKYPSCFRSKSDLFDNFIVSGVELAIKKNLE
jgi:ubiquinone/menaquinone biosynthesis C-methylase UbiE